jgi:hypothetical protein
MPGSSDPSSARRAQVINLATDTVLTESCRALYLGTAGDVKVDLVDGGTAIPFPAHAAGYMMAQVKKIYSTANGTTATGVVALW